MSEVRTLWQDRMCMLLPPAKQRDNTSSGCMYVHVCNMIIFESLDLPSSFLVCEGILLKFIYGHQVKVKVKITGAKSAKIPIPAM